METSAPASVPVVDTGVDIAAGVTRQLLHAEASHEVLDILLTGVHALGGTTVPAHLADETALPVDLAVGRGEPLLPVAEPGSPARLRLQRHLPALVADARQVLDTLARAERLTREAAVDDLTRLGNRTTFMRRLARLDDHDVVVAIDLDGFKATNDTHGHAAGDDVLRTFAACLNDHLRVGDLAARIGGDEFALVLDDSGLPGASHLLDRLRSAWHRQRPHPVDFSAGLATPRDSGMATHRAADDALYAAKAAGRGCVRIAEPQQGSARPEPHADAS